MNETHESINKMWNEFLSTTNVTSKDLIEYEAYSFCDDEVSANDLAKLVKEGKKTSTTSLHYFYEVEDEELPTEDEYSIILDWAGVAQCVIRSTKVTVLPFNEVTSEFARSEGEGDMTLEYWRRVHKEFFGEELKECNIEFSENMLVVCEEFEVVYKG